MDVRIGLTQNPKELEVRALAKDLGMKTAERIRFSQIQFNAGPKATADEEIDL